MSAAKKKRGATAIRNEGRRLTPLHVPHKRLLAVAAIVGFAAFAMVLMPSSDQDHADEPSLAELAVPATEEVALPTEEQVAVEPEAPVEPPWTNQTVLSGDNLSLVFKRAGFTGRDVHDVVSQAPDGKDLAKIYPGQVIAFQAAEDGSLQGIRHVRSPLETAHYRRRSDGGFDSRIETRTPDVRESWAVGEIESSLFLAGQEAGLSQNLIMEMANIFGGVIDFVLDPRVGDTLQLIYEEQFLDGEKYRDGDIVAASFTNQGETYNAYRYRDTHGDLGYFNEEGVSMRKAFLLAPVDFTRISSNFNLRRLHPIYKTTRPHRGTDYAAPTGTPVFAAGDGRVILHKRKIKQGQRVSQSQIIGTVGATGAATGPHLHYEFLMNGVHRNPRTIHKKLPKAKSLPEAEMPRFREAIRETSVQLASLRSGSQLALANAAGDQQQ
jgi:murein DD-endopeptidase MepM/ murein hydrolase activator NlpD